MGAAVFKQPDGLYFVRDYHDVVMYDANPKAVQDYFAVKAAEEAKRLADQMLADADAGRPKSMYSMPEAVRAAREAYADDDKKDADFEEWLSRMEAAL